MKPKSFFTALWVSLVITVLLTLAQYYGFQSDEFLGQKTDSLAKGLLSFYPSAAFWAASKMFFFAWSLIFIITLFFCGVHLFYRQRPVGLRLTLDLVLLSGILAIVMAGALKYPAMFSGQWSESWNQFIFDTSLWLSPKHLIIYGWLVIGLVAGPGLVQVGYHFLRLPKMIVGPVILGIATFFVLTAFDGSAETFEKPHVLLIGIDSLRNDRFESEKVMPNMNTLIKDPQSVYFKDHIVGIARTFPSWVEILQGKYSAKTGIRHMFPGLDKRAQEFAGLGTAFRDSGYETVVVSDFAGDIFPRFEAGFNQVVAPKLTISNMITMGTYQRFPLFLMVALQKPFWRGFPELKEHTNFSDPHHLAETTEEAFHDQNDKPVFMVTFYSTAHFPYASPYPYYKTFADPNYKGPYKFLKNPSLVPEEKDIAAADRKQVNALYDGALHGIDQSLGELFQNLKDNGLWDNTLIIVTADHGEDLYDDGNLQGHGDHLRGENVLRVPLLMKLPKGKTPARNDIPFVSRSIDISKTVASLTGLGSVGEGHDFSPEIFDKQKPDPQLAAYSETEIWFAPKGDLFYQQKRLHYPGISQLLNFDVGHSNDIVLKDQFEDLLVTARHRSLIVGDYKLIYMPTREGVEYELFHRRNDPLNKVDLVEEEGRRADEMAKRLLDMVGKMETNYQIVDGYVLPKY